MMFRLLLLLCLGHCLCDVSEISNDITAHIGDTVMLPCDGPADTDTKEVDVLWMSGGGSASWFIAGSWCETGHYVNRTQLGSIRQNNFSLVIDPVRKEDYEVYICRINHKYRQIIHLNVKGDGKREDAETPPRGDDAETPSRDPVCRPYREREDPPAHDEGGNNENLRWEQVLDAALKAGTGVFYLICTIIAIQLHWRKRGTNQREAEGGANK